MEKQTSAEGEELLKGHVYRKGRDLGPFFQSIDQWTTLEKMGVEMRLPLSDLPGATAQIPRWARASDALERVASGVAQSREKRGLWLNWMAALLCAIMWEHRLRAVQAPDVSTEVKISVFLCKIC